MTAERGRGRRARRHLLVAGFVVALGGRRGGVSPRRPGHRRELAGGAPSPEGSLRRWCREHPTRTRLLWFLASFWPAVLTV